MPLPDRRLKPGLACIDTELPDTLLVKGGEFVDAEGKQSASRGLIVANFSFPAPSFLVRT